jgi:energy-coupling factor transport system permease protein
MAVAASRTTNPLLLLVVLAVVVLVVAARRSEDTWARGFRGYLILGLVIIGVRVVFRSLLDGQHGEHVLVTLPELPLPEAARGIRIGGPVSAEGLLAAFYDGLRLATLLICLGAANLLADPRRLLKAVPGALHELGVALTVTLSVAPQLVESVARVRRATALRGASNGRFGSLRRVAVPVLADALDRSLFLAASMDARGYGRTAAVAPALRRTTTGLVLAGLLGAAVGTYGLLDGTAPTAMGPSMLGFGLVFSTGGFVLGNRRVRRTRYRPDPWARPEWLVAAVGVAVAAALVVASSTDPQALHPSVQPLRWPQLPLFPLVGMLLGVVPSFAAPPPSSPAGTVR